MCQKVMVNIRSPNSVQNHVYIHVTADKHECNLIFNLLSNLYEVLCIYVLLLCTMSS